MEAERVIIDTVQARPPEATGFSPHRATAGALPVCGHHVSFGAVDVARETDRVVDLAPPVSGRDRRDVFFVLWLGGWGSLRSRVHVATVTTYDHM